VNTRGARLRLYVHTVYLSAFPNSARYASQVKKALPYDIKHYLLFRKTATIRPFLLMEVKTPILQKPRRMPIKC